MKALATTAQQIGKLQKLIMKAFMVLIMSYTEKWIALAKYIVSLCNLILVPRLMARTIHNHPTELKTVFECQNYK